MTPDDLLESVNARFYSFKISDEALLNALLKKALGTYQDKAGVKATTTIADKSEQVDVPKDFLARVLCTDATGGFVDAVFDPTQKKLAINKIGGSLRYPLTLTYFVNLRSVDFGTYVLPDAITGLLEDYLEILIQIPNYQRMKTVMEAGELDTSHIPGEEVLQGRKKELEAEMKAARCALPMVSVR